MAVMLLAPAFAMTGPGPVRATPLQDEILTVAYQYVPGELTLVKGTKVTYTNVDVAPHNVIALRNGRDGKPLFGTDTIGAGVTVPVKGVEKLEPGVYDFTCTLHPEMIGSIYVEKKK